VLYHIRGYTSSLDDIDRIYKFIYSQSADFRFLYIVAKFFLIGVEIAYSFFTPNIHAIAYSPAKRVELQGVARDIYVPAAKTSFARVGV